jgi:hypothetical protein
LEIYSGKIQFMNNGVPEDTCPVVKENYSCQHWECAADNSLTPMRECWYCKYSDFRKDISEHRTDSVCHCPANQSNEEEKR